MSKEYMATITTNGIDGSVQVILPNQVATVKDIKKIDGGVQATVTIFDTDEGVNNGTD